jgi:hypothetical protein
MIHQMSAILNGRRTYDMADGPRSVVLTLTAANRSATSAVAGSRFTDIAAAHRQLELGPTWLSRRY